MPPARPQAPGWATARSARRRTARCQFERVKPGRPTRPPHEGTRPRPWLVMLIYPSGTLAAALAVRCTKQRPASRPPHRRCQIKGQRHGQLSGPGEKCAHPAPDLPVYDSGEVFHAPSPIARGMVTGHR
jgi:hypothetical protein